MHGYVTDRPGAVVGADSRVTIAMAVDVVVVRPGGRLDLDATAALLAAVDAAIESGSVAVIDLHRSQRALARLDPTVPARRDGSPGAGHPVPAAVSVIGAGCIRLSSASSHWTIDLTGRRVCRTERPVDPRFVDAAGWTGIREVWATDGEAAVLTTDGTVLARHVDWHLSERNTPARVASRCGTRPATSAGAPPSGRRDPLVAGAGRRP